MDLPANYCNYQPDIDHYSWKLTEVSARNRQHQWKLTQVSSDNGQHQWKLAQVSSNNGEHQRKLREVSSNNGQDQRKLGEVSITYHQHEWKLDDVSQKSLAVSREVCYYSWKFARHFADERLCAGEVGGMTADETEYQMVSAQFDGAGGVVQEL